VAELTVTGYAEVDGQMVTGSATAEVTDHGPHRCGITETIEVKVDASRLIAFAGLVERHAAAIRHDLERFMREERREDGGRM
jgi:hypothetical protein